MIPAFYNYQNSQNTADTRKEEIFCNGFQPIVVPNLNYTASDNIFLTVRCTFSNLGKSSISNDDPIGMKGKFQ